jgi:pimeloyl-ACP methyl ester carboxylesterase
MTVPPKTLALLCLLLSAAACAPMNQGGAASAGPPPAAADGLRTIDHFVRVRSVAPATTGQFAQVYVRERVLARLLPPGSSSGVVLFVHGAGTPAEVAFDVPYGDYSWMAYLARAGFDVFAMDMEGYGRSTRPAVMNDPCNLSREQQVLFVPALIPEPCEPSYRGSATTIGSDWNDIAAVVEYVRALRHVDRLNLAGWSQGGPRAAGFAAGHPDRVERLVLLAPAYARLGPDAAPAPNPNAVAFNTQSRPEFDANWDRQVGCANQYDPAVSRAVWTDMIASDPVGATWGQGVRRAPNTTVFGWTQAAVKGMRTPTLMVSGVHDKQVPPARVREYYEDLGAPDKVFVDLACSSHNAMWEQNHRLLFQASLEWLQHGTVNGSRTGALRIGYDARSGEGVE